jgi:hypothetical protein
VLIFFSIFLLISVSRPRLATIIFLLKLNPLFPCSSFSLLLNFLHSFPLPTHYFGNQADSSPLTRYQPFQLVSTAVASFHSLFLYLFIHFSFMAYLTTLSVDRLNCVG